MGAASSAPPSYCLRCPLGERPSSCQIACADEVERLIERKGAEINRIAGAHEASITSPVAGAEP